jgi:hypothetical protein
VLHNTREWEGRVAKAIQDVRELAEAVLDVTCESDSDGKKILSVRRFW